MAGGFFTCWLWGMKLSRRLVYWKHHLQALVLVSVFTWGFGFVPSEFSECLSSGIGTRFAEVLPGALVQEHTGEPCTQSLGGRQGAVFPRHHLLFLSQPGVQPSVSQGSRDLPALFFDRPRPQPGSAILVATRGSEHSGRSVLWPLSLSFWNRGALRSWVPTL